jgi:predicted N-acetyltransferase YhbS
MLTTRKLEREEIDRTWTIDRSEVIDHIYYFENGTLVLKPEHYEMSGWPPGEAEKYTPLLLDCYDRGGWFCGLFDDARLIGVAVLENKFIGKDKDQLQLKFLDLQGWAVRMKGQIKKRNSNRS